MIEVSKRIVKGDIRVVDTHLPPALPPLLLLAVPASFTNSHKTGAKQGSRHRISTKMYVRIADAL